MRLYQTSLMLLVLLFLHWKPFPCLLPFPIFCFHITGIFSSSLLFFETHSPKIVLHLEIFLLWSQNYRARLTLYDYIYFLFSPFQPTKPLTILSINSIVLFSTPIYLSLISCFYCAHYFSHHIWLPLLLLITNIIFLSLLTLGRLCF